MKNFSFTTPRLQMTGLPTHLFAMLTAVFMFTGAAQGVSLNQNTLFSPTHGLIDLEAGGGVNAGVSYLTGSGLGEIIGLVNFGDGSPTDGLSYNNLDNDDIGVNVDSSGYLTGYASSASVGLIQFDWSGVTTTDRAKVNLTTGKLSGIVFNAKLGFLDLALLSSDINIVGNSLSIPDEDNTPSLADQTDFGGILTSSGSVVHTFTLQNTGALDLNLSGSPKVSVSGSSASNFVVTQQPAVTVVEPAGSITFEVTFNPDADGVRSATLSILSNDPDEASYDFAIQGYSVGTSLDLDDDGMNDLGEYELAALGFDWQTGGAGQEALVSSFIASANKYELYNKAEYDANGASNFTAGIASVQADPNTFDLYDLAQVHALHVDAPLLVRDPNSGQFTLTLGLKKSTNLVDFTAFPFPAPTTSVNGDGKLELLFTSSDNAAFFRVEAE